MIYVVLGVHKSGTTLVSRTLHASGINMVDHADESTDYDEGGHYERASVVDLNHQLLSGCMIPPLGAIVRRDGVNEQGHYDDVAIAWKLPRRPTRKQRKEMRRIIQDCGRRYADWGFKDPRTCLTYPVWQSELPAHALVIVYRGFIEVLKHAHIVGWKQVRNVSTTLRHFGE